MTNDLLALVRAGLDETARRIGAAGGDPAGVSVVAVTKGHGPDAVRAALAAGLRDVGENYAGELLGKIELLGEGERASVRWHYLGAIQRNKVGRLARAVGCWQSVARPEEAAAIARRALGGAPEIFVEIDTSGSPGRPGCGPHDVPGLVESARRLGCRVRGLMNVAPIVGEGGTEERSGGLSREEARDEAVRRQAAADSFGRVADLARQLGLDELSMGMSGDLEEAVAAGTTMVRLGTALFGPRSEHGPRTGSQGLQQ